MVKSAIISQEVLTKMLQHFTIKVMELEEIAMFYKIMEASDLNITNIIKVLKNYLQTA